MNTLILGGESPRHHEWVRNVAEAVQPHFDKVVYLDYRHWASGGNSDIEYEIGQASQLAQELGKYIIIAKSMGTVVASVGTARGNLHPERCMFMGMPLGLVERVTGASAAVYQLPPTVFIQNEHDPYSSAKQVQAFITSHGNKQASFVTVPGDTHDYVDFALIGRLARQQ